MAYIESDDTTIKCICHCCIGETFLASEIRSSGETSKCDYCGEREPSIDIPTLAERIDKAFSSHYVRTEDQPSSIQEYLIADRDSDYEWTRKGLPINEAIQEAAGVFEEPAADILASLEQKYAPCGKDYFGEEYEFALDSYYERGNPSFIGLHIDWYEFEQSLKTKARFFSPTAEKLLTRIFGGADTLKSQAGRPLVVDAGPGTQHCHLFRARVFQTDDGLIEALCRPNECIGSPPAKLARAGRMNAQGISVFYGATMADVAIAEVRPPVGSRVIVAKFDITRQLRLLDLTAAKEVHEEGSIFDSTFKERLHRAEFLRSLVDLMARSVMPGDEGIDYLTTQVVADFLATTNSPRLDGIIFPSVQVEEGNNVVLFHDSAKVAKKEISRDTEITASLFDAYDGGWDIGYSVTETVPPPNTSMLDDEDDDFIRGLLNSPERDDDHRKVTLQLITESIEVHHVNWVKVSTESHTVQRYRCEKRTPEF